MASLERCSGATLTALVVQRVTEPASGFDERSTTTADGRHSMIDIGYEYRRIRHAHAAEVEQLA